MPKGERDGPAWRKPLASLSACTEDLTEPPPFAPSLSAVELLQQNPAHRPAWSTDAAFLRISVFQPSFAGLYFERDGRLVIATTGGAAEADLISAVLDEYGEDYPSKGPRGIEGGSIEVRSVDYSFATLAAEYDHILRNLLAQDDVRITDINERENRIVVKTAPNRSEGVLREVQRVSETPELVEVRELEEEIGILNDHLRSQFDTLLAGIQIYAQGMGECTLGATITRVSGSDTIPGILTASHCTGDGSDMFDMDAVWIGQPTYSVQNRIARESIDPSEFSCADPDGCRYSDAAIADLESGVEAKVGFIARTIDRNADTLEVDEGNPLPIGMEHSTGPSSGVIAEKIGRTSGWTWDEIGDTCETWSSPTSHSFTILCSYEVLAWAAQGDSGSPVFTGGTYYNPPSEPNLQASCSEVYGTVPITFGTVPSWASKTTWGASMSSSFPSD